MPTEFSEPPPRSPPEAGAHTARLRNDLVKAWRRGPRGWIDLVRAVHELALANRQLRARPVSEMALLDRRASDAPAPLSWRDRLLIERVAYAIAVMGQRVPWRSDCLVQALAARRWLEGAGIASVIGIGTRRDEDGEFAAHAWLYVGETIVTGGDIDGYAEFVRAGLPETDVTPGKSAEN